MPDIKELLGKESLLAIKDYIDTNRSDVEEELSTKEDKSNKITSLSASSTDTQYPSAKAVFDFVSNDPNIVETTWANLKTLRDSAQLIPGRHYRITDYITTTTQSDTSSAGHQFDVIVLALSNNKLSEEAKVCLHEGDTYFANNKLEAWQIQYSLDNDATRFAWADSTNGKGVIHRMIDEFGNDVPYDFKNILFTASGKYTNAYTFSYTEDSIIKDASLLGLTKSCYSNVMKEFITSGKSQLNFNVFYSTSTSFNCFANTFNTYCRNNTFRYGCNYNTFGSYCNNNSFNNRCTYNTLNTCCYSNTIGPDCSYNTFANGCSINTLGSYCQYNTFNAYCRSNTIAYGCNSNFFGSYCHDNSFGEGCSANIFGSECFYNTFGEYCRFNTFGSNCIHNTFSYDCDSNTFGSDCSYNVFGEICVSNTLGNSCSYVTFGDSSAAISRCQNNIFDNGCRYIYFNSAAAPTLAAEKLQNVHIHSGVTGTSSSNRKTITVDRGLSYTTDVYPIGSTELFI